MRKRDKILLVIGMIMWLIFVITPWLIAQDHFAHRKPNPTPTPRAPSTWRGGPAGQYPGQGPMWRGGPDSNVGAAAASPYAALYYQLTTLPFVQAQQQANAIRSRQAASRIQRDMMIRAKHMARHQAAGGFILDRKLAAELRAAKKAWERAARKGFE